VVRLDELQHRAAPRPYRLPEDVSPGGLREAEAARPQGGGRGPDEVYRESAPVIRGLAGTQDPGPPARTRPDAGRGPGHRQHDNHL